MKATLVFFERMAKGRQAGFGYASYKLAMNLHAEGLLDKVICRLTGPDMEIPREKLQVMFDDPWFRFVQRIADRLTRILPFLNRRRILETIFDQFAARNLESGEGAILFCSRPLFLKTIQNAKDRQTQVWLLSSVPHPMINYAMARNEELKHGVRQQGPVTDLKRTERLAQAISMADKMVTMDPEIGAFVHDSYAGFMEPERIIRLKKYFSVDPVEYAALTGPRQGRTAGQGVIFLHVSYIQFIKGLFYLLDAWRIFKETDTTGARLVLVGRVDKREQALIDRSYADLEGVEYRGYVPDLLPCFVEADVFVSPSVIDAGPATIIEAMAAGLPVISSQNCGFASLLTDGEDGFTYPYNDVPKLASILAWFSAHPEEIPRLSENAFNNAQGRSIDDYVGELTDLIRDHLIQGT